MAGNGQLIRCVRHPKGCEIDDSLIRRQDGQHVRVKQQQTTFRNDDVVVRRDHRGLGHRFAERDLDAFVVRGDRADDARSTWESSLYLANNLIVGIGNLHILEALSEHLGLTCR